LRGRGDYLEPLFNSPKRLFACGSTQRRHMRSVRLNNVLKGLNIVSELLDIERRHHDMLKDVGALVASHVDVRKGGSYPSWN
jgi:hypothetical protein